jgi:ParB family chromosome partitioning protein
MKIPIDSILPNPQQPRHDFDADAMEELVRSIKSVGLLQPIAVEEAADQQYILIDGERRLRACKLAGFTEIQAVIRPPSNGSGKQDRLVMALVANLQREDLNPIEEAKGYQSLIDQGLSNRDISKVLGVNEVKIYNALTMLRLEQPIQDLIERGKFTTQSNVIAALLRIPDAQARVTLAQALAARGLGKNSKALANSIELINRRLAGEMPYADDQAPAVELATKKAPVDLPKWDVLYQAGKAPSWGVIYKSALDTCNACPLRPAASEKTCKNCQAAKMLREMIEQGTHEAARLMAQRAVKGIALKRGRPRRVQPG